MCTQTARPGVSGYPPLLLTRAASWFCGHCLAPSDSACPVEGCPQWLPWRAGESGSDPRVWGIWQPPPPSSYSPKQHRKLTSEPNRCGTVVAAQEGVKSAALPSTWLEGATLGFRLHPLSPLFISFLLLRVDPVGWE